MKENLPAVDVPINDTIVSSPRSVPDSYVSSNSSWTSTPSIIKPLDRYLASVDRHEQISLALPREILPEAPEHPRGDPKLDTLVPANYPRLPREPAAAGPMLEQWCAQAETHEYLAFGLREYEVQDAPCLLPAEAPTTTEAPTDKAHAPSTSDISLRSRRPISPNARLSPDQFPPSKRRRLDPELENEVFAKTELYPDITKAYVFPSVTLCLATKLTILQAHQASLCRQAQNPQALAAAEEVQLIRRGAAVANFARILSTIFLNTLRRFCQELDVLHLGLMSTLFCFFDTQSVLIVWRWENLLVFGSLVNWRIWRRYKARTEYLELRGSL